MNKTPNILDVKMSDPHLERVGKLQAEQLCFKAQNGLDLPYCQVVLDNGKPDEAYALEIFFHGAGERGVDNARQLIHGASDMLGYCRSHQMKIVALFPQCPEECQWVDTPWSGLKHEIPVEPSLAMSAAMDLLDAKIREFQADMKRIYVSGISMGGYGTWDLISRRPDFFAAAFPICGGGDVNMASKLIEMPILTYHSDDDGAVPVERSRDMDCAIRAAGGKKIIYRELHGVGHGSWTPAFADMKNWEWFFSQSR